MIQNKIFTIIGQKGHGKTKLTEILICLNRKPCIIADPRYQYEEKEYRRFFKSVGHFRKYIMNTNNLKEFYTCRLELVINGLNKDSFDELAALILKMKNISFLVDEIDMFADARMTNKSPFYHLIHYGRHNQIDIFTTSRRSANISRDLTSQTDIIIYTKVKEPNDQDYIKKYIGDEFVQVARNLPKFSFLVIDENDKPHVVKISSKAAATI